MESTFPMATYHTTNRFLHMLPTFGQDQAVAGSFDHEVNWKHKINDKIATGQTL